MKKITVVLTMALLLGVSVAHAKKYGSAGCGLGSQVMGKDGSQVLAATTNSTSGNQTFGITSGTSNCTDDGGVATRNHLPVFIEANKTALANDVARGNGETLSHVSRAFGCSDSAAFNSTMQKNFGTIFPNQDVNGSSVNDSIVNVIKTDSQLASTCRI
jgi:hypothetical protein